MVTVWCHFFGVGPRPSQERVLVALTRAGVSTSPISASEHLRAGIVFFDKPNLELYELIAQTSRNGLDRVLAVAMSGASAVRGCTWELLGHGASDVFAWDHSGNPCREIAERFERWSAVD